MGYGLVTSEAKRLVPGSQPTVLLAGHEATVAFPGISGVALHLLESAKSPAECSLSAVATTSAVACPDR